jgi:Lipocalin-like domain
LEFGAGSQICPGTASVRQTVIRFALHQFYAMEEMASMRSSALLLFGFVLYASSAFSQTESEIRDRIVGTWKLVSTEDVMKDGTTRPMPSYGPHGKGFLMYQRDGYMCADLVNPDRVKWADPVHATPEEKVAAADGTFAYCGRYEIDVKHKQIIHLPEVATDPGYVGSRQIRPYNLQDDRLILGDVEKEDPTVSRWKIVWEKAR